MNHTLGTWGRRAGVALAVAAAVAALATGAQAQQFTRADISLDNAGNLQCTFRETGLQPRALISYSCGAEAVGAVSGCFVKNKYVAGSLSATSVFKNVTGTNEEEEALLVGNNGAIGTTLTTEVPESESHGACTEPAESRVVAVRWCNASLVDVTNGSIGATAGELFAQVERTGTDVVDVLSCAELLAAPPPPEEE
jgi:hypothetical protein